MDPTLAAFMAQAQAGQVPLPSFGQPQQQQWTPPAQPSNLSQPSNIAPQAMIGSGAPQQLAFNLPGARQSPLQQAVQPKAPAPQTPIGAQAGMTWLDKMQPWLMALNYLSSQSQPTTIGGGRGGGYSTSAGGLL